MFHKQIVKAGVALLVVGAAVVSGSVPAEAGQRTGTWRNGMVDGPYGPGYYTPYGYYAPGDRTPRPYYSHRGPWGSYGPYYRASRYDAPYCYTAQRRYVDPWGRMTVYRTRVCD